MPVGAEYQVQLSTDWLLFQEESKDALTKLALGAFQASPCFPTLNRSLAAPTLGRRSPRDSCSEDNGCTGSGSQEGWVWACQGPEEAWVVMGRFRSSLAVSRSYTHCLTFSPER